MRPSLSASPSVPALVPSQTLSGSDNSASLQVAAQKTPQEVLEEKKIRFIKCKENVAQEREELRCLGDLIVKCKNDLLIKTKELDALLSRNAELDKVVSIEKLEKAKKALHAYALRHRQIAGESGLFVVEDDNVARPIGTMAPFYLGAIELENCPEVFALKGKVPKNLTQMKVIADKVYIKLLELHEESMSTYEDYKRLHGLMKEKLDVLKSKIEVTDAIQAHQNQLQKLLARKAVIETSFEKKVSIVNALSKILEKDLSLTEKLE